LGTEPGVKTVPEYAVPARRNDLRGLPPTWIGVGDIDLVFDEDKTYADRLKEAGGDCTLDVVPGAPHGFESIAFKTKLAQAYLSRSREWLREQLAGTPGR
jgi:acetyl esterase/lipase